MNEIRISDLDPGLIKLLKLTAWRNGKFIEEYARQLIIEALQRSNQSALSRADQERSARSLEGESCVSLNGG